MAEPLGEQIIAKIEEQLAAIEGDGGATFWYTPGEVNRADYDDPVKYDTTSEVFYEIRVGDIPTEARTTSQRYDMSMEIFVTAARKDRRASTNPTTQSVGDDQPSKVRFRLGRDAKKKIANHITWPGLGLRQLLPTDDDQGVHVEGWVVVHLRFMAIYTEQYAAA